ncbi:Dead/h (asp-glu-ala-asp/his) box polypeptide 26 (ddx26), mRNA protein [Plakobranchus ocellatus]|uniref:Dead/h (Asp-glu-ala-asp/his) box polypeptide 26 (Ddx26), mRNA protein n=1 Tax=Plakobranchus ocellatus TaxID=259542 RepID=A0AAV3Z2T4_9GAST|nr:Dead/h (asp-glu-ala-asp/his) box polypeptide 26 (ddx26), mRNA protein [Plakobranchus ocellatus]
MTIILFLVDTSASMNQRTYLGTALIDVAKAAVENIMKSRSRDASSRWDRYMLLTFEDPPANVKAGWKESHFTFASELKNLQATGLSSLGPSLKHAFDLLNLNRMTSGIETYGQGRSPFYNESTVIIVITDGGHLTTQSGIQSELNLPMGDSMVPGADMTKEPFRWDQRIFSLVMRLPASVPPDVSAFPYIPSAENSAIDIMCEVTGGRSYAVYSQKMLNAAIESLVQKVQCGVVINFEKFGPDPPPVNEVSRLENGQDANGNAKENQDINKPILLDDFDDKKLNSNSNGGNNNCQQMQAWHSCRKLIYVPRSAQKGHCTGHWPIPEGYWPDISSPSLPPRTAHPIVQFSCQPSEPLVIENLPFDKYELEPSPLTQYILERRQPNTCWQVFVANSSKSREQCHPFGYLKASSSLTTVNLFVMPYNYPVLLPLLEELFKTHNLKPNQQWRHRFDSYLRTMPGYYAPNLRRALARMGAPNLVSDTFDNCLSYSVITNLKKLKNQARMEMDRLNASIGQKMRKHENIRVNTRSKTSILQRKDFNQLLANVGGNIASLKQELQQDYSGFTLAVQDPDIKPQTYRNPYDISRKSLLDQISRMRNNFLRTSSNSESLIDLDERHCVPVGQMGNYQEVLKRQPPALRELESTPTRLHMFGNPFKVNKQLTVDEAEEAIVIGNSPRKRSASESPPNSPNRKRKPGPLPRDLPYRRPPTPSSLSPPSSPAPSMSSSIDTDSETEDSPLQIITESDDESSSLGSDGEESNSGGFNHLQHRKSNSKGISNNSSSSSGSSNHTKSNHINHSLSSPTENLVHDGKQSTQNLKEDSVGKDLLPPLPFLAGSGPNSKDYQLLLFNRRLKMSVIKEVKRPGRNFSELFKQLSTVRGSLKMQIDFVHEIIHEAKRFKRKSLIQELEKYIQVISNRNNPKLNNFTNKSQLS